MKIIEALRKLDPNNDDHWTSDGLPKLDAVEGFLGESAARADISKVAPKFTRKNNELPDSPAQGAQGPAAATPGTATPQAATEPSAPASDESGDESGSDLDSQIREKDKEVQAARKEAEEATAKHRELQAELDELVSQREREVGTVTTAVDIKRFQESQRKQREQSNSHMEDVMRALRENGLMGQ